MRVALDAMGGDHAPVELVNGALQARAAGVDVVLVGRPEVVLAALARAGAPSMVPVVAAAEVVGMHEEPALALRTKRDTSIRVAAQLVAAGEADALVSAGSTGATLAAALLCLGRLPGVRRPVIAAVLPSRTGGKVVLVDAGGSADAQPEALVGYAEAGVAYAAVLGVDGVRVGLLNVGSEPGKGSAAARAAYGLLGAVSGFVGNVEPEGVLDGRVDVVVSDGFTGNIFLKAVEAASAGYRDSAAVVLGVAGEVLVAHGAARAAQVAAALRMAVRVARAGLSKKLAVALASRRADAEGSG